MKYLLYSEDQAGTLHVLGFHTDKEVEEKYKEIIEKGVLTFRTGDRIVRIAPAYIALVEALSEYDFVLGDARKDPPPPDAPKEEETL